MSQGYEQRIKELRREIEAFKTQHSIDIASLKQQIVSKDKNLEHRGLLSSKEINLLKEKVSRLEESKKRFRAGPTMTSMGGMRKSGTLRGKYVK